MLVKCDRNKWTVRDHCAAGLTISKHQPLADDVGNLSLDGRIRRRPKGHENIIPDEFRRHDGQSLCRRRVGEHPSKREREREDHEGIKGKRTGQTRTRVSQGRNVHFLFELPETSRDLIDNWWGCFFPFFCTTALLLNIFECTYAHNLVQRVIDIWLRP